MKYLLIIFLFSLTINFYGQTAKDYFKKGESKLNSKECGEALQDFNKAIELDTNYKRKTYYPIGVIKYELKDYTGAIQYLTNAIKVKDNENGAYFYRGKAELALGDKQGACKDWYIIRLEKNYNDAQILIDNNCSHPN
ncbi:MAG: tetratricopeptide repeat protein [Bacteroidia bacterium]